MRTVPEWIGTSDNAAIPPRVQLRIFDKYGGRCACGCGREIRPGEPWNPDHILALCNGGQNRESNLHPLLLEHHKVKTRADLKIKSRIYKAQLRHVGVKERRQPSFARKPAKEKSTSHYDALRAMREQHYARGRR